MVGSSTDSGNSAISRSTVDSSGSIWSSLARLAPAGRTWRASLVSKIDAEATRSFVLAVELRSA
jgi:hypothetical protein